MPRNIKNSLRYVEDPESAFDSEELNNEIDSNNSSNNSSRGFSWANFAMGIPSAINTAKENLSATQEFSGSVWDNDNNKSRNGWQTADALLGFGNNMFYAANPWANPEVQGKIAEEKNKFDTFSDSLENINYANTSSLLEAQKDFNNLELGMTLEDFGGNRDAGDRAKSVFASAASGAASGSIGGPWGMLGGAISGLVGGLIGVANEDTETAKKMYKEFQRKQRYLNNRATVSFDLQKNNIMNNDIRNLRGGMVAAFGGDLSTQGGNWSDGLTFVNTGGSHSENPYGGVPVGIAPDQRPNLVEEGEIIWNDYVFSDRIKVPKTLSEKYKLKDDVTFAKAVEKIQKGAEERPNDKIEQDTLNNILSEFMTEQEIIRQKKAEKQAAKELQGLAEMFADGGGLSHSKDYGSKKKPYPSVDKKDFAGGGRSYPIPTKADAIDALRLAGLHHRPDVKAKVYKKYPELKHEFGGYLFADGGDVTPSYYQLSDNFYKTLKELEGFASKRYTDNGADSIGYGFRGSNMPKEFIDDINKEMTQEEADTWLPQLVEKEFYGPLRNKKGFENLNPNQIEALVSYLYNVGMNQPKLFKALEEGNLEEVVKQMDIGEKDTHKMRRTKEKEWFNTPYKQKQQEEQVIEDNTSRPKSLLSRPLKSSRVDIHAFGGPMGHYFPGPGGQAQYLEYASDDPYWWMGDYKGEQEIIPEMGLTIYTGNPYATPQGGTKQTQPSATDNTLGNPKASRGFDFNASYLRYAPVLGSAISSIAAALDTPNRTYAKKLRNSARAFSNMMQPISSKLIANYLKYDPLDRMFYTNQFMSNAAATRSAVRQNANANRQAAINSLLAADYNANIGLGNLFRQAEEFNREQRERVTGFNRETDRYNSAIALDVTKQNAATRQAKASMLWDAAQKANMLDMQEDQLLQASRNQALTNLFNNLGGVGKEEYIFQMMRDNPDLAYYLTGLGNMKYKKPE